MKYLFTILCLTFLVGCNATAPIKEEPPFVPLSEKEMLLIDQVEYSGRVMYEKDIRAAKASDLVLSRIDQNRHPNFVGWVTYANEIDYTVSFYEKAPEGTYKIIADVVFSSFHATPDIIVEPNREPTTEEVSMIKARIAALTHGVTSCSDRFNTIVMPGRDSAFWEVYTIAATTDYKLVPVGGHIRTTISKKTGDVVNVENLSKSCLILDKYPESLPEGAKVAMLTMSHIVSPYPIEIHTYLNLLHSVGFAVITERGVWLIRRGQVSIVNTDER